MSNDTVHFRRMLDRRGISGPISMTDLQEVMQAEAYQPQMAPDYADDRNYPLPAVLTMSQEERRLLGLAPGPIRRFDRSFRVPDPQTALVDDDDVLDVGATAVGPALLSNLVAAMAATVTMRTRSASPLQPLLRVRVRAVACRNDDGLLSDGSKGQSQAELGTAIAKMIAAANKIFKSANIELVFYPSSDLAIENQSVLNQDFIIDPLHPKLWQQPPLSRKELDGLAGDPQHATNNHRVNFAQTRPDRLLLLFAEGTIFKRPEQDWRWCNKCQGLHISGVALGVCPAGGQHSQDGSGNYALALNATLFPGQANWRWCQKCQGLFFTGHGNGACPAGGQHDGSKSGDYRLAANNAAVPGQDNWRWCRKCQGLFFAGNNKGHCPAGGQHDMSGSGNYTIIHNHAGPWLMTAPATFAFSGGDAAFVRLTAKVGASDAATHDYAPLLGHEVGHYFHLAHTHNEFDFKDGKGFRQAKTIDDVRTQILNYVTDPGNPHPVAEGANVFDYDLAHGVKDTPPDTGNNIFHELHSANADCDLSQTIPDIEVTFSPSSKTTYKLSPDRRNVMSYFKHCTKLDFHYSFDQATRMRHSLLNGNRRPLVAVQLGETQTPGELVCAVWNPSTQNQTYVWGYGYDDFRQKFDEMHAAGMRLHAQQAFVRNGQVLYDGIWKPGSHAEYVIWGWSVTDFKAKAGEMAGQNMRLVHLESYVTPDKQVLVNALWHPGDYGQQWVQAWQRDDFMAQCAKLAGQGYRLADLNSWTQPDGQERHDAIWNPGTHGQHYIIGWKPEDFRAKYDEMWGQKYKLLLLDAHLLNQQVVYNAVWNPSPDPQFVAWGRTREQVREHYDEMWQQGMRMASAAVVRLA